MDRARIEAAARRGGLTLQATTDLLISGSDPVLATPFHLGEGAAVVLGLVGQAASAIGAQRDLPPQALSVDVRHAAASLHSFLLLRTELDLATLLGSRARPELTRVFPCRDDRYIHLHQSFNAPEEIMSAVGVSPDAGPEALERAVSAFGAFELEDELAAAGLCGAVCRTPEEWRTHEQGRAIATSPLVTITKIAGSDPVPWRRADRPLAGVRVLDLTRVLAGPTVARTLAEHGADVLHVSAPHLPTVPLFEIDTGHGKRQASLDLRVEEDAAVLRELVGACDVFSQSFQAGSLARRGFGVDDLAALRPGIVCVSENAYGHVGPWRDRPGWEQLAQAATGVTVQQSAPVPAIVPAAMNDYTTGYLGALGAMVALDRRASEGGSYLVEVSLARTAMWFQDLGADLDPALASGVGDLGPLIDTEETAYGPIGYLRPALRMSVTPPSYAEPVQPLGSGEPRWVQ